MRNKKKIIRACTVPQSIGFFKEIIQKMRKDEYEEGSRDEGQGTEGQGTEGQGTGS